MNDLVTGGLIGILAALLPLGFKLRQESIEREKQRVFDLRTDIYLKLIENFTAAETFFINLAFQGLLGDQLALNSFGASTRKINLVGSNETVTHVNQVAESFSKGLAGLRPLTNDFGEIQQRISVLDILIGETRPKVEHALSQHREACLDSKPDAEMIDLLASSYKFIQGQLTSLYEEQQELFASKSESLKVMQKFGAEQVVEMAGLLPKIVCCIRGELALDFDEKAYLIEIEENRRKAKSLIQSLSSDDD